VGGTYGYEGEGKECDGEVVEPCYSVALPHCLCVESLFFISTLLSMEATSPGNHILPDFEESQVA
jgi:hypothetical protein